ncbi:5-formyltetrahydrofolate cyclo-ligase [uncultured Pseudoteredinibacter sp.]|uniref:5-formyltetrahydrofolate cyclo-ligase n=1 Tax=uncultured Pseudoteredinibacter sp. TaxID=1641701 RepID=UPI0026215AF0|nr:5-formyltetrahydrofolate cyclo-ligase [uncultured Pseudoteredinibacter sp.]
MTADKTTLRKQLRQHLRQQRQSLSAQQQQAAAEKLSLHFAQLPELAESQNIAAYLASDGELDLSPCIELIWGQGKQCYLPRVTSASQMEFRGYRQDSELQNNRYGIAEPSNKAILISPEQLDLVLLPLVGFSRDGGRLGMGGGFYDRAFAFKAHSLSKPTLIGVAHSLQEVEQLPIESWDIPLSAIITEQGYFAAGS